MFCMSLLHNYVLFWTNPCSIDPLMGIRHDIIMGAVSKLGLPKILNPESYMERDS